MENVRSKTEKQLCLFELLRNVRDTKFIVKKYVNMSGTTNDYEDVIMNNPDRQVESSQLVTENKDENVTQKNETIQNEAVTQKSMAINHLQTT